MASSPIARAISVPSSQSASAPAISPAKDRTNPRLTSASARSRPASGNRSSALLSQYSPSLSIPEICQ